MAHAQKTKDRARDLRVNARMSLKEISASLGVSKSTLSLWLRDHSLTEEERRRKGALGNKRARKQRKKESNLHKLIGDKELTRKEKSKIAESAALLRLSMFGMSAFCSPFDGDKADWIVENPKGGIYKVQVRWAKTPKNGLPLVSLCCADGAYGQRRFREGEFDFLVAYNFYTDTAYVWSWEELTHLKSAVTIAEDASERWDKMLF